MNRLSTLAESDPFFILSYQCVQTEQELYLKPWTDILHNALVLCNTNGIPNVPLPGLFSEQMDASLFATQYELCAQRIIQALSSDVEQKKVLLFIDDIQWMDPASLRLLANLLHWSKNETMMAVLTVRDDCAQNLRSWKSTLESKGLLAELAVPRFTKDETIEIIRQYASGLAYWVSEPDKGLYDAMNKGLRQATGDYLVFLNAGDTFHTADTLNQIVNGLQRRKSLPDVIYGETRIVDAKGKLLGMRRLKAPKRLTWKSFKMGMLVCHQSFYARREIAPLYDLSYRYSADYDWCLRCLKSARSVYNARAVLSDFLEAGLSTANRKASLRERYEIMYRYYGKFQTILLHGWFAIRFYWAKWVRGRV